MEVLHLVLVLFCRISVLSSFASNRAGCFNLIVFLMACGFLYSVALVRGAEGWSAVCDCGISLSYSITFLKN